MEQLRQLRAQAIVRTTLVGGISNLVLSVVKIAAGWFGHSYALIADGIHSLSDLLSDLMVWYAGHKAGYGPDQDHPYGHARFETVATLAMGFLLLAVAIGIGWDAGRRLFAPESLLQPEPIALYAALASILIKESLYWYTLAAARRVRSDLLRANAWHHRSDAISSIVVVVGLAGTLAGLPYLDDIAAILVALMIARIAWDLGWQATRELVDTGLDPGQLARIREIIMGIGGVRDAHMLRTRTYGGRASADVHVLVDPRISVSEGHAISVLVEQRLKREIDDMTDVTVHIDPEDDETAPPTMGLPMRTEALARLAALWSDEPAALARERVVLHYLDGQIEVDLLLPLGACGDDPSSAAALAERLQQALTVDPVFARVNCYFG